MSKKRYYHITDICNVESILSTGLQPHYNDAASAFMMGSDHFNKHIDYELRTDVKDVVFICEDPIDSVNKMGSYLPLWSLAVIEIELDESVVLKPKFAYDFELVHSGTITPDKIVGHSFYTTFEDKFKGT